MLAIQNPCRKIKKKRCENLKKILIRFLTVFLSVAMLFVSLPMGVLGAEIVANLFDILRSDDSVERAEDRGSELKNILNNILQVINTIAIVLLIPFVIISIFGEIFGVLWIEKLFLNIGLSYNFFIGISLSLIAIIVIVNFVSCKYMNR